MKPKRLQIRNLGSIRDADVAFGDLTVLVGPQASGKNVFLEMLKLIVDRPVIQEELEAFRIPWNRDEGAFLENYLGRGMSAEA